MAKWKRCRGGLVRGDLYIETASRGGRLMQKATEQEYENDHRVEQVIGSPWGEPSYARELEAGPIPDLRQSADELEGHWYTRG